MDEMYLKLIVFKRVLKYFIAHHEDYPLYRGDKALSELYTTYSDGWLYWDCFNPTDNPFWTVSKQSLDAYLIYMRERMSFLIPQVIQDMRNEYAHYSSMLISIHVEMDNIQANALENGFTYLDEAKYNNLEQQRNALELVMQQYDAIGRWQRPRIAEVKYSPSGVGFRMELD